VYSADDQVTLTPDLELFVYARSDRWLYILQGKGLVETQMPEPESFSLTPTSSVTRPSSPSRSRRRRSGSDSSRPRPATPLVPDVAA
jgi:hypothetical protein